MDIKQEEMKYATKLMETTDFVIDVHVKMRMISKEYCNGCQLKKKKKDHEYHDVCRMFFFDLALMYLCLYKDAVLILVNQPSNVKINGVFNEWIADLYADMDWNEALDEVIPTTLHVMKDYFSSWAFDDSEEEEEEEEADEESFVEKLAETSDIHTL